MIRWVARAALTVLLVAPLSADVKITSTSSGKALGQVAAGESIQYFKGARMRVDTMMGSDQISTIYDVDAQKIVIVNHRKKEADIYGMQDMAADLRKVTDDDIKVKMTPNGQTKQILDQNCQGYDLQVRVAFSPVPDQPMTIALGGPVWIAKNAPGRADVAAFYNAAAEKGFILSDPRAVKAQPGQAKGMTAMYRAIVEAGTPYGVDMTITIEGSGMMAAMMNKMGASSMSSTVTAISVEPLSEDVFRVPADYKSRTR